MSLLVLIPTASFSQEGNNNFTLQNEHMVLEFIKKKNEQYHAQGICILKKFSSESPVRYQLTIESHGDYENYREVDISKGAVMQEDRTF